MFCLRSLITLIYGYSFQFGMKTSTCSKKRSLINAPDKRRRHLLIFRFFQTLGAYQNPPPCIIFRVFKVWNHFSSFEQAYTQLKHEIICFVRTFPFSFLSFEWSMFKCLSIYETSSCTLKALQRLHLKVKIFFVQKQFFYYLFFL